MFGATKRTTSSRGADARGCSRITYRASMRPTTWVATRFPRSRTSAAEPGKPPHDPWQDRPADHFLHECRLGLGADGSTGEGHHGVLCRAFPELQDGADNDFSPHLGVCVFDVGQDRRGIGRQFDACCEQLVFALEEVVHHGRIHAGFAGYLAQACSIEPLLREKPPGGSQYGFPGVIFLTASAAS